MRAAIALASGSCDRMATMTELSTNISHGPTSGRPLPAASHALRLGDGGKFVRDGVEPLGEGEMRG
jgi:hypothetical protein